MKKTILAVFLYLIVSSSAFAFTSEEIYDKGSRQTPYHPKSAYSVDGGFNYEDYMGKPQSQSVENSWEKPKGYDRKTSPYHFEFEANINPSVVEGRLAAFLPLNLNSIGAAVGILYEKDNFTLGNGDFTIGNRHNADIFTFDIGFRGLIGSAEKPDSFENGDVKALGFLASGIYNIIGPDTFYRIPLNFELAGEIVFAPKPLCLGDAEQVTEIKMTFGLDIFGDGRGFIFIGGRYIDIRLNKSSETWDASGGSVFGGFKLRF